MLLVIDIGNTDVNLGVFEGQRLKCTWRVATDPRRLADEYAFRSAASFLIKESNRKI